MLQAAHAEKGFIHLVGRYSISCRTSYAAGKTWRLTQATLSGDGSRLWVPSFKDAFVLLALAEEPVSSATNQPVTVPAEQTG